MNKRLERLAFLSGLVLLLISPAAAAAPADYQGIKASFGLTAPINELAVSKKRFVIALDKNALPEPQLYFLDTWNWRLLNPAGSDTVKLGAKAVSAMDMDLNSRENRLYFSYSNGWVQWMDLAPLHALGFNGEFDASALHVEPGETVASGAITPGKIVALQDSDSASLDCVFVELKDAGLSSLIWLLIRENTVIGRASGELLTDVSNLELAKSGKRIFAQYRSGGVTNFAGWSCFSQTDPAVAVGGALTGSSGDNFKGLGSSPSGQILVAGDHDQAQLWPYRISRQSDNTLAADLGHPANLPGAVPADQIWTAKVEGEKSDKNLVFYAQGAALKVIALRDQAALQFADTIYTVNTFLGSPLLMADSSPGDGYLYVSPRGWEAVSLVTANPMITALSAGAAGTVLTETFHLKFATDVADAFYTIVPCSHFTIDPASCGEQLASGRLNGNLASITLNSRDLGEGEHILAVFLRDLFSPPFHQGRNALKITIDLPPPPQEFDLGWGDQRLFVKFKSPDTKDLGKYLIYYGTHCSAGFYQPQKIDKTGGYGDPPSPIIIKSPERDHDYEKVIEGLVNDREYCAQVVLTDKAGNRSVSERNYATPQKTKTPSEEAGEKGNISCDLAGRGATPRSDLVWIFLPLLIFALGKIKLRSRR